MSVLTFNELKANLLTYLVNATEIPADKLNELLQDTLDTIDYNIADFSEFFKGLAQPTDDPGTPTNPVMYQASGPGTFTNFGGLVVTKNFAFLVYNGSTWELTESDIAITPLSADLDANGHNITGLADGIDDGDAINFLQSQSSWLFGIKNKDIVQDWKKITTGTFTYGATHGYQEKTILNSIVDIKIYNPKIDRLYKINWMKEIVDTSWSWQIYYSDNNGTSWAILKAWAITGTDYAIDEHTLYYMSAIDEIVFLKLNLEELRGKGYNYYLLPYPDEGNIIFSNNVFVKDTEGAAINPFTQLLTEETSLTSPSLYELEKGNDVNSFSLKFDLNLAALYDACDIRFNGSGLAHYFRVKKHKSTYQLLAQRSGYSNNITRYISRYSDTSSFEIYFSGFDVNVFVDGIYAGYFNMKTSYDLAEHIYISTSTGGAVSNLVLKRLDASMFTHNVFYNKKVGFRELSGSKAVFDSIQTSNTENFITTENEFTRIGGTIESGSFGNGLMKIPFRLFDKGTVEVEAEFDFDPHATEGDVHNIFEFNLNDEDISNNVFDVFSAKINTKKATTGKWFPKFHSSIEFRYGYQNYKGSCILEYNWDYGSSGNWHGINKGDAFSLRYIGTSAGTVDADLCMTINDTQLLIHHFGGSNEAAFTLSSYTTVRDLINAINSNTFCSTNFEMEYLGGIDDNIPINLSKMYDVYFIDRRVVQTDMTQTVTNPTTPPADPTPYPDWDWEDDAFPVHVKYSAIGTKHKITFTWGVNGMRMYIDGFMTSRYEGKDVWQRFPEGFLYVGGRFDGSEMFNGTIHSIKISNKETKRQMYLPLEIHDITDSETEVGVPYYITTSRIKRIGQYLNENNFTCITANELLAAQRGEIELPARPYLWVVDDSPYYHFTTQKYRDLYSKFKIRPSCNFVSPTINSGNLTTLKAMVAAGWDVHSHSKYHVHSRYLKYADLITWLKLGTQEFIDNGFTGRIMTIPYSSTSQQLIQEGFKYGIEFLFDGVTNDYLYQQIPQLGGVTNIRFTPDDNTDFSQVKAAIDNLIQD